jgi:hypothetical protein
MAPRRFQRLRPTMWISLGRKRVGSAHDRSDVEIVFEVLDGNVEGIPFRIKVGDDRVEFPVAVLIDHVPVVAIAQQLRIQSRIIGKRARPRAYSWTYSWAHARSVGRVVRRGVVGVFQGSLFKAKISERVGSAIRQATLFDRWASAAVDDHRNTGDACAGFDERIHGSQH